MVAVKHDPTPLTDVGPDAERLLDSCATRAAIGAGIGWLDTDHWDLVERSIIGEPENEAAPGGITDRLCQMPIFDEVGYPQFFIGKEIVR